ncbi:stage III sporulation protein AA [Bacillus sp. FJAT-47783]|uniref:stage III sporulation protein AA n=1 Tax=Bacillus sp. FJAT-47783 TaxID=2922712 RepID=UPI001FADA5E5|nr:stage III sporulation protein AA [Bacillus sp. FJAT-47783]
MALRELLTFLPDGLKEELNVIPPPLLQEIEEVRIRVLKPVEVIARGRPKFLRYRATLEDSVTILNKISQYSIYALEEELKRGYITVSGGHRIGLAGKVVTEHGAVKAIRHVTSFNIRVAKEKVGISNPFVPYVYGGKWLNTLIFGPPQTGKTTLLRDFARLISSGTDRIKPAKVGIVDERSEIAGSVKGIPQHQFGIRVDVLDACPKAEGMMMLIRSMSPDVIIADEIGRKEDTDALFEAINSGVQLFVSAHGESFEDLLLRPTVREIIQAGIFDRYILLSRRQDVPGNVEKIMDRKGKEVPIKARVTPT